MPHVGVVYLGFMAVAVLVGLPIVLLADRFFGPNQGRDDGIWTVVCLALLVAVLAASR